MNAEAQVMAATIAGEHDPRPVVALPRPGLPGLAIAAICIVSALLLFLVLDGRRESGEADAPSRQGTPAVAFSAPPPLILPAEQQPPYQDQADLPPLRIATVTTPGVRPSAAPPAPAARWAPPRAAPVPDGEPFYGPGTFEQPQPQPEPPLPAARSDEPALVLDTGGVATAGLPAATGAGPGGGLPPPPTTTTTDPGPARLGKIGNPAMVMPVGTLIQAVLETPIDTAKPGLARAIVSRDARGFDGRQVLVPRGSRLAGEYQSDVRSGQKKVLINWTQLIRPDGSVIRLDSPAADGLGGAGVPGRVSGMSLGRFAQGVLRTALSIGTSVASWSSRGSVIVGLPGAQLTNVVGAGEGRSRHRIKVGPGTMFNVFVARNLDFSGAAPAR